MIGKRPRDLLDLHLKLTGATYGAGFTLVGGYKNFFATYDSNYTISALRGDLPFDNTLSPDVKALLNSIRVGWRSRIAGCNVASWLGGTYWDTTNTIKGTPRVPVIGEVKFRVREKTSDPWSAPSEPMLKCRNRSSWRLTLGQTFPAFSPSPPPSCTMLERRVKPLAEKVDCKWVEECDVTRDDQIMATAESAAKHFGKIDILVHSIAFAGREELSRPYHQTSRDGFKNAMDISVFSLVALTNAFLPYLNPGASVMCLTYGSGATKVAPHYNVMGVAKAALESSIRYLAYVLGPKKIRVNAISAGPIRTLAAAGVGGFRDMYKHFADAATDRVRLAPRIAMRLAYGPF